MTPPDKPQEELEIVTPVEDDEAVDAVAPSPAVVEATIERIPDQQVREALGMVRIESQTMRGPLPPADMLAEYDQVLPGLAREIVDHANEERKHRHRMDEKTGDQEFWLNIAGLVAILLALLMMLAIVAYMVSKGFAVAGAGLGTGIIVGVVVALTNYRKAEPTPMTTAAPPAKTEE